MSRMSNRQNESVVLGEYPSRYPTDDFTTEIEQPALAPTDGGKAAWLMLASCCLIQLPVWGMYPRSLSLTPGRR